MTWEVPLPDSCNRLSHYANCMVSQDFQSLTCQILHVWITTCCSLDSSHIPYWDTKTTSKIGLLALAIMHKQSYYRGLVYNEFHNHNRVIWLPIYVALA